MDRAKLVQLLLTKYIQSEPAATSCKGVTDLSISMLDFLFILLFFFSLLNLNLLLLKKLAVIWNRMKGFLPSVQSLLNSLFIVPFTLKIKKPERANARGPRKPPLWPASS